MTWPGCRDASRSPPAPRTGGQRACAGSPPGRRRDPWPGRSTASTPGEVTILALLLHRASNVLVGGRSRCACTWTGAELNRRGRMPAAVVSYLLAMMTSEVSPQALTWARCSMCQPSSKGATVTGRQPPVSHGARDQAAAHAAETSRVAGVTPGVTPATRLVSAAWAAAWSRAPWLTGGCRPVTVAPLLDGWHIEHRAQVSAWGLTSEVIIASK